MLFNCSPPTIVGPCSVNDEKGTDLCSASLQPARRSAKGLAYTLGDSTYTGSCFKSQVLGTGTPHYVFVHSIPSFLHHELPICPVFSFLVVASDWRMRRGQQQQHVVAHLDVSSADQQPQRYHAVAEEVSNGSQHLM